MSTDSLVMQLQKECLDGDSPILDVLRRALVVARKLALPDFQDWIQHELSGYGPADQKPEYRFVSGQLKAWNPYNRSWVPVVFSKADLSTELSTRFIGQPIGELETLLRNLGQEAILIVPLYPELEKQIMRAGKAPFQASLHVTDAAVQGIIDQVRNSVLNWCLDLEKAGILGEGMAFSSEEKQSASQINYTIHFHRDVTGSQIQQGNSGSSQSISSGLDAAALKSLSSELWRVISELGLPPDTAQQLTADLKSVDAQLGAPQPKDSVLRECLSSIRNILEGCVGSALTSGLLHRFGSLLP